jgi:hypothetical protein
MSEPGITILKGIEYLFSKFGFCLAHPFCPTIAFSCPVDVVVAKFNVLVCMNFANASSLPSKS